MKTENKEKETKISRSSRKKKTTNVCKNGRKKMKKMQYGRKLKYKVARVKMSLDKKCIFLVFFQICFLRQKLENGFH